MKLWKSFEVSFWQTLTDLKLQQLCLKNVAFQGYFPWLQRTRNGSRPWLNGKIRESRFYVAGRGLRLAWPSKNICVRFILFYLCGSISLRPQLFPTSGLIKKMCLKSCPVIHFGFNASPKVPSQWVISIALAQLIFWLLMTIGDELRVSDSDFNWGQHDEAEFLQWSDATLGVLSSCSLLLVGHLVKTQSNLSWQGLMFTSFVSMVLFTYVLCESLFGASVAEKMVHYYQQEVLMHQLDSSMVDPPTPTLQYFPPVKTVIYMIFKISGKSFRIKDLVDCVESV